MELVILYTCEACGEKLMHGITKERIILNDDCYIYTRCSKCGYEDTYTIMEDLK